MSLPSSMDYTKILPIAAGNPRQMRRTFLPMNGQSFSAVGNNIIRIEISASQFWDPSNSYLKFTLTGGNAAANTAPPSPPPPATDESKLCGVTKFPVSVAL